MNPDDESIEVVCQLTRYLERHIHHEGFHGWGDVRERTIGWRCSCQEEGFDVEFPMSWYKQVYIRRRRSWAEFEGRRQENNEHPDAAEDRAKERAAENKARDLLLRFLSKKQVRQLEEFGYFDQLGGDGKLYRLWAGQHRSIELVEDNTIIETLCIHPKIWVPASDTLLAQKLLVQGDVKRLRKTANITRR